MIVVESSSAYAKLCFEFYATQSEGNSGFHKKYASSCIFYKLYFYMKYIYLYGYVSIYTLYRIFLILILYMEILWVTTDRIPSVTKFPSDIWCNVNN